MQASNKIRWPDCTKSLICVLKNGLRQNWRTWSSIANKMITKFDNHEHRLKSWFGNKNYKTFKWVIDVEVENLHLDFQMIVNFFFCGWTKKPFTNSGKSNYTPHSQFLLFFQRYLKLSLLIFNCTIVRIFLHLNMKWKMKFSRADVFCFLKNMQMLHFIHFPITINF